MTVCTSTDKWFMKGDPYTQMLRGFERLHFLRRVKCNKAQHFKSNVRAYICGINAGICPLTAELKHQTQQMEAIAQFLIH